MSDTPLLEDANNPLLALFKQTYPEGTTLAGLKNFIDAALGGLDNFEKYDPDLGATVSTSKP